MKRITLMLTTMFATVWPSRTLLMSVGALIGLAAATGFAAEESRCLGMLDGAPEGIRGLEAVQACRGADAGCGYLQSAPGYGVLTLICPHYGVQQVLFADRLSMLQIRDGALIGECKDGSWQRDAALPGCYPPRGRAAGEP